MTEDRGMTEENTEKLTADKMSGAAHAGGQPEAAATDRKEGTAGTGRRTRSRGEEIVRTSVIGILANVFLAGFKAAVGILTHSIAITLDAVNNLSDALSSVITIVGARLAGKPADKKHPLGYGRIEYLSVIVISLLVLYAGLTSLEESVKKILHPTTPEYTAFALIIVAVGVAVKIILGRFVSAVGRRVDSDSLVASGTDATLDAVISFSTLIAAILYLTAGIRIEAWLGAAISVVIIRSGLEMLRDTISQILGERLDCGVAKSIKKTIRSVPGVYGAYDLVLHNYGPGTMIGSVHIEIPDTYTAEQIDILERDIQRIVYQEHQVILTGIGIYSMNTRNDRAAAMRNEIRDIVVSHDDVLQMHGFFLDEERKEIRFDMIVDYNAKDRGAVYEHIYDEIQKKYPAYHLYITMDGDISD